MRPSLVLVVKRPVTVAMNAHSPAEGEEKTRIKFPEYRHRLALNEFPESCRRGWSCDFHQQLF